MRKYSLLWIGLFFIFIAVVMFWQLLSMNGLTQNSFTPFIWLEKKYCVWDYDYCQYYVEGWWFEETEYSHVGDEREFRVSSAVYSSILEPWADGSIARICILETNRQATVVKYSCWPSFQSFLPVNIK